MDEPGFHGSCLPGNSQTSGPRGKTSWSGTEGPAARSRPRGPARGESRPRLRAGTESDRVLICSVWGIVPVAEPQMIELSDLRPRLDRAVDFAAPQLRP